MLAHMIRSLARGVSLIGHPLLLLPVAALALAGSGRADPGSLFAAVAEAARMAERKIA